MISQAEQNVINSNFQQYVYSIEFLDKSENSLGEVMVDVVNGSANFDASSNSRRSVNLTLKNLDGSYIPAVTSKMWISNKFRLKAGYQYNNNQQYWYNQGTYFLGNPTILSNPSQKEVSLQGLDKWAMLDGTLSGKLSSKYIIPLGTQIDSAIIALISGIVGETRYIVDTCTTVTPYTITKKPGDTIASLIIELCGIVTYEAFYDNNGFFRFRKALQPQDYAATAPSWYFTTSGTYLEGQRQLDWNSIRNSIAVFGMTDSVAGVQYTATAQDTDINSPFSIPNIGERFEEIEDQNIPSNDLCQTRASYSLQNYLRTQEKIPIKTIPIFPLELEQIVNIIDSNNGTNGNYLIQTISYSISYDTVMTIEAWQPRTWYT